jgi:hypothetical protein
MMLNFAVFGDKFFAKGSKLPLSLNVFSFFTACERLLMNMPEWYRKTGLLQRPISAQKRNTAAYHPDLQLKRSRQSA